MFTQRITRTAALGLTLAATLPASALGSDLRTPDARDAATPPVTAVDLRSPDARDVPAPSATMVDLRSPDARDARPVVRHAPLPVGHDLRSPDARYGVPAGGPVAEVPQPSPISGGTDWGGLWLALGITLPLLVLAGSVALTHRRRPARGHTAIG